MTAKPEPTESAPVPKDEQPGLLPTVPDPPPPPDKRAGLLQALGIFAAGVATGGAIHAILSWL